MKKLYLISTLACMLTASSFAQLTKLMNFNAATSGQHPTGSLLADSTYFYGLTQGNGANHDGIIFRVNQNGSGYLTLREFTASGDGRYPMGSLIADSTFLYGMTYLGGVNNAGIIFKIKPDSTGYTKLLDFTSAISGSNPKGDLLLDSNFLYGMTNTGGTNSKGVVFKIGINGNNYTKLLDFDGTANGSKPGGSLICDSAYLYGMTAEGGIYNDGVIFKIKRDGTAYVKLLDFGGSNGRAPYGSLIADSAYLYGMTKNGGATDDGVVFKIRRDGTGYVKLFDFSLGLNGRFPMGTLYTDGTFLYGMTQSGGYGFNGVIFKIMPDGTSYVKLYEFTGSTYGSHPQAALISNGNVLYGMTMNGGNAYSEGTIFKYNSPTTSVNELSDESNQLLVYPNPAKNEINISINEAVKNPWVSIYNVYGKKIYAETFMDTHKTISTHHFLPGIYFVKVRYAEMEFSQKLVIMQD